MKVQKGELIVGSVTDKYPSPPANDNASPKRWRSFSPFWWSVVQGLIEGLTQRILWQEWNNELHDEIVKHMLPEEVECEDCPEPPPPKPPKSGGGGGGGGLVGEFGLTIEELEGLIAMSVQKIKWIDGILHVQYFGCCDLVPVEGMSVPVASTVDKPYYDITLENWEQLGKPPIGDYPVLPHENPLYVTEDSKRCAKATALAGTMRDTLELIETALVAGAASSGAFSLTLAAEVIAAGIVTGGWAVAFLIVTNIAAAVVAEDASILVSEVNELRNDEEFWETFLCTLVGVVTPGEKIDPLDIKQLTLYMSLERGEDTAWWLWKVLQQFPVVYWQELTQNEVATTDCGCSQYLPIGVNPPLPEGAVKFQFKEFGHASDSFPFAADGTPYNAVLVGGARGEMFGGSPSTEHVFITGEGNHAGYMQAVFEFTAPVTVTGIKLFFTYPNGTPSETQSWSNKLFTTTDDGEWLHGAGWGTIDENPEVRASGADLTAFSVALRTSHAGSDRRIVLSSVLVSGVYLGEVFTDLPVDTVFQT